MQVVENSGIIGFQNSGSIQIQQTSLIFNVSGYDLKRFGIIGYATQYCTSIDLTNIKTLTIFTFSGPSSYGDIGGLLGYISAQSTIIRNAIITYSNENMNFNLSSGGLVGWTGFNSISIINTKILNSNICSLLYAGGFIGTDRAYQTNITSSTIQKVYIFSNELGIITGQTVAYGIYNIQLSKSIEIYINTILQADCGNLSNTWSITQC
ncbi:Hypothetical_protein [Hexamita inflata]|uniref:Hypothetical_protein n=1 Tax=Hexamita inflata TaxID=28002 RepID=A0ABP1GSQ2_9EUKA